MPPNSNGARRSISANQLGDIPKPGKAFLLSVPCGSNGAVSASVIEFVSIWNLDRENFCHAIPEQIYYGNLIRFAIAPDDKDLFNLQIASPTPI